MIVPTFICCLIGGFTIVEAAPRSYEGSTCQTNEGEWGLCVRSNKCDSAVASFRMWNIRPTGCGFQRQSAIICCPGLSKPLRKSEKVCRSYTNSLQLRRVGWITDGAKATLGEFPHMVAIGGVMPGETETSWWCGGTLISDEWVLTAAHCNLKNVKRARLGLINLADTSSMNLFKVTSYKIHPQVGGGYHDVALLRLSPRVRFSTTIQPACLNWRDEDPDEDMWVTGWGATTSAGGSKSLQLMKAKVLAVPLSKCNSTETYLSSRSQLRSGITPDILCAADPAGKMAACTGDSGGPLQAYIEDWSPVSSVIGITSQTFSGCGGSAPTVFMRVSRYVEWIENIVWP